METKQNISSSSLFHFINRLEFLNDILRNGFQARYVAEIFPIHNTPFIIPMKCFCDLPLGVIKHHVNKYGKYGIGISKEFAIKNGITPCIYVHENSRTLSSYLEEMNSNDPRPEQVALSLLPYFKKYEEVENIKGKNKTLRYYDEREWRYIPSPSEFYYDFGLSFKEAKDSAYLKNMSLPKTKFRIGIDLKSIKYIFIKNEKDVTLVIREIRKRDSLQSIQDYLISKIISTDQLFFDF